MALFNADGYQEGYRLANGNTKNMIITEVGKRCCSPRIMGQERDRLVRTLSYKLDLTRPGSI